jgi:hypothetical protein
MTTTDLRIKFKLETGDYPTWVGDIYGANANAITSIHRFTHTLVPSIYGKLKSIYGFWLEDKLGNSKKLREEFYKEFSIFAKYEKTLRKPDILKQEYIFWLEEKMLDK